MDAARRVKTTILDKPLSRGKQEISLSVFALLFSEMIQYSQNKVRSVSELQVSFLQSHFYKVSRISTSFLSLQFAVFFCYLIFSQV